MTGALTSDRTHTPVILNTPPPRIAGVVVKLLLSFWVASPKVVVLHLKILLYVIYVYVSITNLLIILLPCLATCHHQVLAALVFLGHLGLQAQPFS